ncbi:YncE family protein [Granulicella arctica]|uniref:YVTN family beta-propeller protein n=1 Tax=Granulicella arctica TaxID=940613 RepID=A0A7Y9PFJ3_9BACT|nr:YncE family protein [Granulicella arctica]NYF78995.1 YVTN family beta-propeller protein [Granulicella arctica]
MKIDNLNVPSIRQLTNPVTSLVFSLGIGMIFTATVALAATPTTPRAFRIQSQWNIGGKGGWGFLSLDPSAHRLYIPRTDRVTVIDTETGKVIGEIDGMTNVRDVTLDSSGRYGYVTDPTDGTAGFVRVFDRASLRIVTSIPTGRIPDTIVFDSRTQFVFAFNSHSHSATIIDSTTNQAVATIPLVGRPGSAVADGNGGVFVTLPALGEIAHIDAATKKVIASWQLASCAGPAGLTVDPVHRQFFTTCEDHHLVAIDMDTRHVNIIGEAPANSGDIAFDPKHDALFLANAAGTLTIFHRESPTEYSMVQQLQTQAGARTMAVSNADEKVYLITSKFGQNTAAVSEELQFRPTPIPGTFSVITIAK